MHMKKLRKALFHLLVKTKKKPIVFCKFSSVLKKLNNFYFSINRKILRYKIKIAILSQNRLKMNKICKENYHMFDELIPKIENYEMFIMGWDD